VQLLLIRHALPLRSEPVQGSDPHLSDEGVEQAQRLPEALKRFPLSRLVSSPQQRSVQTARPVADALGLAVEIDERLAEYDRDMAVYIPIEQIKAENPEE
jgi:broad specificity phosphatase PhoE